MLTLGRYSVKAGWRRHNRAAALTLRSERASGARWCGHFSGAARWEPGAAHDGARLLLPTRPGEGTALASSERRASITDSVTRLTLVERVSRICQIKV